MFSSEGTMEDKSTAESAIMNWITRLTRKITSGKIVPVHYAEDIPAAIADAIRSARAVWIVGLPDSTFDIDGLFDNCETRKLTSLSPAQNRRRLMFPCPVHSGLGSEPRGDVIRRTKLAQNWGFDVKWVDHEILQSMVIVNPPTEHDPDLGDGLVLLDVLLPNTTARAKFEITQKDQETMFSDLVRSFSRTWGTAHDPSYKRESGKPARRLTGLFVA
jgi:hypothetical protein